MFTGVSTRSRAARLLCCGVSMVFACAAHAQWTITNLQPALPAGNPSIVWGIDRGSRQFVGEADFGPYSHAGVWTGPSPSSWVDLHPASASGNSSALAAANGQQVGYAMVRVGPGDSREHASLWSGSAASWTDLHPAAALGSSRAVAAHGGQQAGWVRLTNGSNPVAALWSGTASSFVNLNPQNASYSFVSGMTEGVQVGSAVYLNTRNVAGMWTGTAASWQSLHPPGFSFNRNSGAVAASAGQQVGYVEFSGGQRHASLWTGSAASWVDLHPAGATTSDVFAVSNGWQVGTATTTGLQQRASLWNSTAESWEDLSLTIDPNVYASARATSVWTDATTLYVGGSRTYRNTFQTEAILWTRPIPSPSAAAALLLGLASLRRRRTPTNTREER